MKKILLLGGASHQVIAIQKAKEMGLFTILCDWHSACPGAAIADRFYEVSTTDWDGVYEVARREKVDGVLAYASDPAALTAAYVQKRRHLACGIPFESVQVLSYKHRFRDFLDKNRFSYPRYEDITFSDKIRYLKYPVIVKPSDSSGSKGITVVRDADELTNAWNKAYRASRCKRILAEEVISTCQQIIGGDVLILDGHVELLGLFDCIRDESFSLIPAGKSYPPHISIDDRIRIKNEIQRLSNLLRIKNLEMNVEVLFREEHSPMMLDIGPRCGGNRIPEFLSMIYGIDLVTIAIRTAIGERITLNTEKLGKDIKTNLYRSLYVIHTDKEGILKDVQYQDKVRKYIVGIQQDVKTGNMVEPFTDASKKIGTIDLWFPDVKTQKDVMRHIEEYISVFVEEDVNHAGRT